MQGAVGTIRPDQPDLHRAPLAEASGRRLAHPVQAPISPFGAAAITIMVVRQGVPDGGSASRNSAYCFDGLLAGSAGWCWPSVRRVARDRAIQRS
jgi:hypothetical protein